MISDEDFLKKVDQVIEDNRGQMDDIYSAIGLVVVGRRYGWRVMRIASRRGDWTKANKMFGDLKVLLPPETRLSDRSLGLQIAKELNKYWEIIRGTVSVSAEQRKAIE